MPQPPNRGSSQPQSWRGGSAAGAAASSPGGRRLLRVLLSLALLTLSGVLAAVLWYWFIAPRQETYLLPLAIHEYRPGLPPLLYSDHDVQGLPGPPDIEPVRATQLHDTGLSLDNLHQSIESANRGLNPAQDVLLIYLSGHWISSGGEVYLVDSNYDPQRERPNRNPSCRTLTSVLEQLNQCRARLTLVLLDAGRVAWEPRWGQVMDQLPKQLEQAVAALKRPAGSGDLWVLSACSRQETAQLLHSARRSLFATFASMALKGAADRDRDRQVSFREFHDFVSLHVDGFARTRPGRGSATQTPLLLQAGVGANRPPDLALAFLREPWNAEREYEALTGKPLKDPPPPAKDSPDSKKKVVSRRSSRSTPTLAQWLIPGRGDTLAQAGTQPAAAQTTAPPSPGSTAADKTPAAPPATEKAEGPQLSPQPQPQQPAEPAKAVDAAPAAPAKPVLPPPTGPLDALWRQCDDLSERGADAWMAVDYAPHLWRELLAAMADYSWRESRQAQRMEIAALETRVADLRSSFDRYKTRFSSEPGRDSLRQASAGRREVLDALRLRNELVFWAPYYIGWHAAESLDLGTPIRAELELYLDRLIALSDLLSADASSQSTLEDRRQQLATTVQKLETGWRELDARLDATLADPDTAAKADGVRYLATTPLPYRGHQRRQRLKQALERLDTEEALRFKKYCQELSSHRPTDTTTHLPDSPPQLAERLELQIKLVTLAEGASPRVASLGKLIAESVSGKSDAAEFSHELEPFYRELPATLLVGGPSLSTAGHGSAPMAERRLRLVDPWFLDRSTLDAHALRLVANLAYPTAFLEQEAQLALHSPAEMAVAAGQEGSLLELQARASGDLPAVATLTLEFDPQLVGVALASIGNGSTPAAPVASEGQGSSTAGRFSTQFTLEESDKPQIVQLRLTDRRDPGTAVEGQPSIASLKVRLESDRPGPARDSVINLRLPGPERWELVALGADDNWASYISGPDQLGLVLLPFPSGVTTIRLGVRNLASRERAVEAELWIAPDRSRRDPADRPSPLTTDGPAAQGFQLLAKTPQPVKVPAEANSRVQPLPLAPPPPPADAAKPPAAAPTPPAAPPAAKSEPKPDPRMALDRDLLCVLRSEGSAPEARWIDLRPRHPAEYLQPSVRYRKSQRQVEVSVTAKSGAQLRPAGCQVSFVLLGAFGGRLPAGKFNAAVRQGQPGTMDAIVPADDGRPDVELWLHADAYPRAFVYRFRTDQDVDGLLPLEDLRDIKIVQPDADHTLYDPDVSAEFPVELRVEAPWRHVRVGAQLVIGMVDPLNPGVVQPLGRRLPLDFERAVDFRWEPPTAEGGLQIATALADFKFPVETGGFRNKRVRMITALELGATGERKEDAVELVFDSQPPTLTVPTTIVPAVQGGDLSFSVRADDGGLSGVARVEYEVDLQQLGQMKEPKPASFQEADIWTVAMPELKLAPGRHQVLVRAVDHVGRMSVTRTVTIAVERPPAPVVPKSSITISIESPASYADVTVNGAAKGKVKPGAPLVLRDQPPGKYKIEALGHIRNKIQIDSQEVDLQAGQQLPVKLNLSQDPPTKSKQK